MNGIASRSRLLLQDAATTPLLKELRPTKRSTRTLRICKYPLNTLFTRHHTSTTISSFRQLQPSQHRHHRPRISPNLTLQRQGHGHGQIPKRNFHIPPLLSSLLSSTSNSATTTSRNNSNNSPQENPNQKLLTASRTLPYPASPLFDVISSVESYADFLPFLNASTVTKRDPVTKYPTEAFLTVGYGPLSETFTSRVICDRGKWIVEAKSGEKYAGADSQSSSSSSSSGSGVGSGLGMSMPKNEAIFTYLNTRWQLTELGSSSTGLSSPSLGSSSSSGTGKDGAVQTRVQLQVAFEFKSAFHAAVMSAVEGQMADVMIEAFEKRIRERVGAQS